MLPGAAEPALARSDASRAFRWFRSVIEFSGETRLEYGLIWVGGGCVPCDFISVFGIVKSCVDVVMV